MTINLTSGKGKVVIIEEKPFNSGGQGGIHRIIGANSRTVAKIFFHQNKTLLAKAKKLESKIQFMIQHSPITTGSESIRNTLVWPIETLYKNGNFVGFTMQMAGDPRLKDPPIRLTHLCLPNINKNILAQKNHRVQNCLSRLIQLNLS